jgi:Domain of unknown function (DUF4157)
MDSTRSQIQVKNSPPPSGQSGVLQRKCACGQHTIAGGECDECGKKHLSLQRSTRNSEVETRNSDSVPAIVHDALRSPGQPLDSATRAFFEPRFGHDFSRVRVHDDLPGMNGSASNGLLTIPQSPFQMRYASLKGRLEEAGEAACDPDKGKVVFKINYDKFPFCMADCVFAHEKAHADFGQAECAKVSAAAKAATDAVEKAKKSGKKEDVEKAEQALKDFEKAKEEYDKWVGQNCKEDEEKAYQAGIDKCKSAEIQKQCADSKETTRYTQIMKQWEDFKKAPPNCAPPPKQPSPAPSGTAAPPTTPAPKGTGEMGAPRAPSEEMPPILPEDTAVA